MLVMSSSTFRYINSLVGCLYLHSSFLWPLTDKNDSDKEIRETNHTLILKHFLRGLNKEIEYDTKSNYNEQNET